MQKIIIFTIIITIGYTQRLSYNDQNCDKYLKKFGTANNIDGSGATKLAFTGDISFVNGADVKVNLRYSDVDLFNDPTYFGLVKEDGKPEATTCLDLKLWKFTSNTYSDPVQVTDLPITSTNNFQKQWRYYSFTIPGGQLSTRLVETSNTNQFIYKGYFAVSYYPAGTDQVQYTFFFEFAVTIEKGTGAAIETAFKPLTQTSTAGCTPGGVCTAKADTTLKWCTDLTCAAFETPDLHLNDQFVLLQTVTTTGMNGYYLTGTEVWYTGNGLNKKATPISINNTVKGQVIIQLRAEIAWRAVTIRVTSVLSTNSSGSRRLLIQTTYDSVSGQTDQIECIKAEGKQICATCEEECKINGYANETCDECSKEESPSSSSSNIIIFAFMVIFMLL
ncbi:unnamed protein product [Paramecium sonneborni]|uniref:Uncharacterized protein n=1 Tax=Paramecium sonneborni TaxID=65129 RepID=A0A8S1RG05_9CILI|nr:unnamed protein product [Paramecium sonneborni]